MFAKAAAAVLLSAVVASAVPCVQFDTAWNLYAFGGSSDVNLGANTTWASPSPTTLTTTGRPPWTGNYTQCILNQNDNIMYVIGGDSANPGDIYVYNFGTSSWSTQTTSGAPANLGNSRSSSVLDHDTVVIYTLPGGSGQSLYQLDLSSVTASASSSALAWSAVENPSFSTDGYTVTMAEASNHINFFGIPSTTAGSADLFVVHYAYFQPTAQAYPTVNGGTTFPDTPGQAISVPLASNDVQYQMVFIPTDFSNTYVVTHWTDPGNYATTSTVPFTSSLINSTQILPAPSSQDANAAYAASDTALVQIDAAGDLYYITGAFTPSFDVATSASWTKMSYTLAGTGGTVSSSSSSSTSASASASSSASASASSSVSASGSSASAAATTSASPASGSASASAAATSKAASAGRRGVELRDLMGVCMGVAALGLGWML
ncbi:hypothetical protein P7C73_g2682, partial [Tremellales sp. Uapishka_1]